MLDDEVSYGFCLWCESFMLSLLTAWAFSTFRLVGLNSVASVHLLVVLPGSWGRSVLRFRAWLPSAIFCVCRGLRGPSTGHLSPGALLWPVRLPSLLTYSFLVIWAF